MQQREKQVALEADLVIQESIQLIRAGKIHRLRDINVRPTLGGKKSAGVLELHSNGVRYQSGRGAAAFSQPLPPSHKLLLPRPA